MFGGGAVRGKIEKQGACAIDCRHNAVGRVRGGTAEAVQATHSPGWDWGLHPSEACWLGLGTAVLAAGWDWVGTGDCSPLRSTGTGRCSPEKKLSCHLEIE